MVNCNTHGFLRSSIASYIFFWCFLEFAIPQSGAGHYASILVAAVPLPRGRLLLDCAGDAAWTTFREHMRVATETGRLDLRPETVQFAEILVSSLLEGDGLRAGVQQFYEDICSPTAESFCVYGAANALFVVAAHSHRSADSAVDASEASVFRAQAQDYLRMADWLVGSQHCLDFRESSSWPIRADDVLANVNISAGTREFSMARDAAAPPPEYPPPPFSSLNAWPSSSLATALAVPPAVKPSLSSEATLGVVAVGTHPTLTMEAVTMLRDFAFDAETRVELRRTLGVVYKCAVFPELCGAGGTDPVADLIGPFEAPPAYETYTIAHIAATLAKIGEELSATSRVDMLVCTSPFIVCALLQRAMKLPLLAYFGLPMLWKRPTDHFEDASARVAFWAELQRLAAEPRVVIATNNPLLSEQIAHQSGLLPPVVRVHARFTGAVYVPTNLDKALLVSRTKFLWVTLGCLLKAFTPDDYPVAFTVLNSDSKLSFRELAAHRLAVVVPWEHALMAFFEFYSMSMPLVMPDVPWTYRLLFDADNNLGSTTAQYFDVDPSCDRLTGCAAGARPHPSPPFAFDTLEARHYWYQYSFLAQWPHVHRFTSLPQLLDMVLTVDLAQTSAQMRAFNDRTLVQSVAFWRHAGRRLLGATSPMPTGA
eukprot:TRINITY_DN31357_c0_g1_i1.p1 TRINITY_DN31357_c0_g1~~TRINITY_DN31357_c0_g1_i1.p1  ORF type:complete len:653 (-),score=82.53 TRINITY_DN31357_c0_g1_i1:161-2119(-)